MTLWPLDQGAYDLDRTVKTFDDAGEIVLLAINRNLLGSIKVGSIRVKTTFCRMLR
jgi:hypothetical protein